MGQTVYALDSTTIDLCLSLFPWARFRATKAAIKLHTLLDLRGPIPTMIAISDGKQADVRVLDDLLPEPGAFYVLDRGYLDFQRLYRFVLAGAFFVTRTKAGVQLNRLTSRPVDRSTGVCSDHVVWLRTFQSASHYPERLRRVRYRDLESGVNAGRKVRRGHGCDRAVQKCGIFMNNEACIALWKTGPTYGNGWPRAR